MDDFVNGLAIPKSCEVVECRALTKGGRWGEQPFHCCKHSPLQPGLVLVLKGKHEKRSIRTLYFSTFRKNLSNGVGPAIAKKGCRALPPTTVSSATTEVEGDGLTTQTDGDKAKNKLIIWLKMSRRRYHIYVLGP